MAYQVLRGWPAEGAIDEIVTPAVAGTILPGTVFMLDADGNAIVGNYADADPVNGPMPFFCIDIDSVTGKVVGLKSHCLIEVCPEHYAAGVYTVNADVTVKEGKFALPVGTERVVAKVRSINATTGVMKLVWVAVD